MARVATRTGDVDLRPAVRDRAALAAAIVAPPAVSAALVPIRASFSNTDAALLLVTVIVAVAAGGHRLAGYLAAAGSAVWFDFFLTEPYERFTILRRADVETTVLLLVIGMAVTELAVWGRRQSVAASRRAGYVSGLYTAAESAAGHGPPTVVIQQVTAQLATLLELRSCRFQHGVAGVGGPARLHHDGHVTIGDERWPVDRRGLPAGELELLVQSGGYLRGRFLMTPIGDARPSLENRLIAVALADQVGAAFGRQQPSPRKPS